MTETSRTAGVEVAGGDAAPVTYAILDQTLWTRFQQAETVQQYLDSWLGLVTRQIDGLSTGLVVAGDAPDVGPFRPVSQWPAGSEDGAELAKAAEQALAERRGIVLGEGEARRVLAHPLMVGPELFGAVAVSAPTKAGATPTLFRRLQWASGWIELMLRREQESRDGEMRERMTLALDMLATLLEHPRLSEAAPALVTDLARRLDCETVSLGFLRGRHVRVRSVSNAASFGRRANLIREVGLAMDEAVDQEAVILWPAPAEWDFRVARAHEDLARSHGVGSTLTIPLLAEDRIIGALTFERREAQPFTAQDIEMCDAVAAIAGPILEDRRRAARWLPVKIGASLKRQLVLLFGPRHFAAKLATVAVVAVVALLWATERDYAVSAPARLEGTVQRSVVAPFNGYLATQNVRAGDLVQEGDILAVLDEKDLTLEQFRLSTAKEQRRHELDRAIAERKMAEANIVRAQLDQLGAQLGLVDEQLSRTRIRAPFAGYVVEGDLSQQVGGSIERGQTLFRIAPLNAFRVVLEIDERDISEVRPGQEGVLRLAAFPETPLAYRISAITPLARQGEGRNYFRVEADLLAPTDKLRPGMAGISRTGIAQRLLAWVMFHDLADWARLTLWRWAP